MKTFSPGLSDSIASVLDDPRPCPHCDSSSHIAGGLCVGCLLEAGLSRADEDESETLTELLADLHLPDQNWRLGNYEILEEIGRGGMGVIYRARQRHSRRIVAVKRVLSYHSDSRETLARFRREAQAAASLDHPNILPIYEVSESEDGLPFFSMKFAPGGTLQQVAPALRSDPRQCVALVAKIARAVQYAHSRGILHRDLKPGNILLDGRGEPLVSDFGLAKWLDTTSDLTRTLTIFGTPGYIAPEQASAAAADLKPTADIYSLGAILFDLLAGRPPFLGAHALSVIRQAAESPAPKLRTLSKIADRDLETICSRCLEREPSARYRSAHDLADDLERWLEGRPIIARPIAPPLRLLRSIRRNPKASALIAAVVALTITVVALRLQSQASRRSVAAHDHSVVVESFFNLDRGETDREFSAAVATALNQEFAARGPGKVTFDGDSRVSTPVHDNEGESLRSARASLCGTYRVVDGKARVVLRLLDSADRRVIYRRVVEMGLRDSGTMAAGVVAPDIYSLLSATELSPFARSESDSDPGWRNRTSREFLLAGKAMEERRSLEDVDRAIDLFTQACTAEPTSSLAFSRLAEVQSTRAFLTGVLQHLSDAEASALQAVRINPRLANAHAALALVRFRQGQFRESLIETFVACELADSDNSGFEFRAAENWKMLGQPARAVAWYRFIRGSGSRPGLNEFMIGDCLADLGDDDQAEVAYKRASALFPELPEGWMGQSRLALLRKDFVEARRMSAANWTKYRAFAFSKAMAAQVEFFSRNFPEAEKLYSELVAEEPRGGGAFYGALSYQSALGRLHLDTGDSNAARRILEQALNEESRLLRLTPKHPEVLYRIAAIHSSLGNSDTAMDYLERAVAAGWIDYRSTELDPRFDSLRPKPEFHELLSMTADRVATMRLASPTQTTRP